MLEPRLWICSATRAWAPAPTATMVMTAPTPMTMPSMVRALRSLLTRSALTAMRVLAHSVMCPPRCACSPRASCVLPDARARPERHVSSSMRALAQSVMCPPRCASSPGTSCVLLVLRVLIGQGGEQLSGLHRILLRLVSRHPPIAEAQDSPCVARHVWLVGHDDDGDAITVQVLEQGHDLHAGPRVEGASGLVGQDEYGLIDEGAGDGDALLLTAGELSGVMMLAIRQPDRRQLCLGALPSIARCRPGVEERQLDVLERGRPGQEIERLKDEADLLVADVRQLV